MDQDGSRALLQGWTIAGLASLLARVAGSVASWLAGIWKFSVNMGGNPGDVQTNVEE